MSDPIVLPPAEYWQLRALIGDVHAAELDAIRIQAEAAKAVKAARQRANERLAAVAKAHGVKPADTWQWNDEQCSLTAAETMTDT